MECDYHKGGALARRDRRRAARRCCEPSARRRWLEPEQLDERIRVAGALGGVFEPEYARVQPAALARGLADVVERLGVGVYEATRVESIAPGVARTAHGDVRASWVVRATEGYTPHLGGAPPRALIPLRSTMIVTEPLPDDAWAQIGWQKARSWSTTPPTPTSTSSGRPTGASRSVAAAARTTSASGHDRYGEVENSALDRLTQRLHELWPATREVAVAHGWSGVFAAQRDWKQTVAADPATGLAWAGGYVGVGVCAANLSGGRWPTSCAASSPTASRCRS